VTEPTATAPILRQFSVSDEDRARGEFYAVLGRLLIGPPDAAFLAELGRAETAEDAAALPLARAWNRLVAASGAMDAEAADQEYTELFIGVGKAELNLHASFWVRDTAVRPLVAVRATLAELGLGRAPHAVVYEDHLGALCETMRILVTGAPERAPAPIDVQRRFFERHLAPWAISCCDALSHSAVANYYVRVGEFASAFLAVERDSLAIE
jgi:TorA maturation chaperone TorD